MLADKESMHFNPVINDCQSKTNILGINLIFGIKKFEIRGTDAFKLSFIKMRVSTKTFIILYLYELNNNELVINQIFINICTSKHCKSNTDEKIVFPCVTHNCTFRLFNLNKDIAQIKFHQ